MSMATWPTTSRTWVSSTPAPASGCGPSWPPRSCSSAACSPGSSSTGSPTRRRSRAACRHLSITLGTINTFVLLTSSLTMALAVRAGQPGKAQQSDPVPAATILLATMFLGIKAFEYYLEYEEHLVPRAELQLPRSTSRSRGGHAALVIKQTRALLRLLLLHDRAARDPHGHRHRRDDLDDRPGPPRAGSPPRTTLRWSVPGSTGTSSTWSGSSSSHSST